ncbi:MAG: Nif3-like dinuclear metal center hexameric protein [Campylobacterota bacterium]|nr:Nif3-like dinuclear metal center hexameric protein [Campylobacterota bacterium]
MILQEIYDFLNEVSPFELQEKWDNSGLQIGEMSREISQIVVSLDIDKALIEESDEGVLFVTHHPLIFGGLSALDFSRYPAKLIEIMIQKKQSLIAMHTNFDQTHLNRYVFEKILGFKMTQQEAFSCTAEGFWRKEELLHHIQDRLDLPTLKIVAPKEEIRSVTLTTGAGASLMDSVMSDCFLTGDIKYHDAMKAKAQNLMLVEIGHYESEQFFAEVLLEELKVLPLLAIITNSKNPFEMERVPSNKDKD